jgi:hypothetical protein
MEEPYRILIQGGNKTFKTSFALQLSNKNKNKIKQSNPTETCQIYNFPFNHPGKICRQVEIIDCPGTSYYNTINDIPYECELMKRNINSELEKKIKSIEYEAKENIKEFNDELNNELIGKQIDLHIVTFVYSEAWSIKEALL